MSLFSRDLPVKRKPLRVLTASSRRLDLTSKTEPRQIRALRQGWQSDAWNYRDSIGELRYAVQFLANSAGRMRIYVAGEPNEGESDEPVTLADVPGLPSAAIEASHQALMDLGRGKLALKGLLKALSTNISVAGECFLLGQQDEETGEERWSIRSVDELMVREDGYELRQVPDGPNGIIPWVKLTPERNVVSRIWVPHPRFSMVGDSPLRAMLSDAESLMIMRRMIRSDARSRLGRGLLLVPDEISIKVPLDDDEDPEADPFFAGLTKALLEPISDEGVASAVAPIVIKGPAEQLAQVRHLELAPQFAAQDMEVRSELIGIIATSFDLPKEVIMGVADLNHWSAWQVDDNTFRHHIEPHVIELCDALTGSFLRPYLIAAGVPAIWARRLCFWYDPTELVTHPDQTKDAIELHDRLVISDEAMLRIAGFEDNDRPSKQEVQVRLLEKMRTWPPNLVMAFLHAWDPTLVAPAMSGPPAIPGITPSGVDTGEPAAGAQPPPNAPPVAPVAASPAKPPPPQSTPPSPGPPPAAGLTAAGSNEQLSRKLSQIDRDLRTRLQTAANAAMLRNLERVGARLRVKVAKDETQRTRIAHRRTDRIAAVLGPEATTAAGVQAEQLLEDWTSLRQQFDAWVAQAQRQALRTAAQMTTIPAERMSAAEAKMREDRGKAWDWLSEALQKHGEHLLYSPDPNSGQGEWGDLNPDTLVPPGMIRAALSIAGGNPAPLLAAAPTRDWTETDPGRSGATVDSEGGAISVPVGQIGTGDTVESLLEQSGMEQALFAWEHGPSLHPFEPHLNLDGVQFSTFTDDALRNPGDFPYNEYFFPGDHVGCSCDFTALWMQGEGAAEPEAEPSGQAGTNVVDVYLDLQPAEQAEPTALTDAEKRAIYDWTENFPYMTRQASEALGREGDELAYGDEVRRVQAGEPATKLGPVANQTDEERYRRQAQTFMTTAEARLAPAAEELHRGLGLPVDDAIRLFESGKPVDIPLSSWSNDPEFAKEWATGWLGKQEGEIGVILHVEPGSPSWDLAGLQGPAGEQGENVVKGHFKVARVKRLLSYMEVWLTPETEA